jgi:hypothetical protein
MGSTFVSDAACKILTGCAKVKIFAMRAQAPISALTGILAQAPAEASFQSRPVGVGQYR